MNLKLSLILLLMAVGITINAQSEKHDHEHDHHEHHRNEIGIANAPVYFVNEEAFAYGLHLHYVHSIGETKFGVGLGYERIFDEHKHNTIGIVGSYRPIDALSFNISPGITYEGKISSEINFALHVESAYEFEIGDFHIGPAIEFAYDPEDYHISLGIHLGYGF